MTRALTERELEYLGILQEECAEVIQIISKIRRFGINSRNPYVPSDPDNQTLLMHELGDVQAMVEMLQETGVVNPEEIAERVPKKKKNVLRILNGTVYDPNEA